MSKTIETTGSASAAKAAPARQEKKPTSASRAEVGPAMAGCDILVQALEREGVEVIFAYPGGASMEIHQSLTKSKIRTILPRHEQGGSFAAEGYGRATGKAGVCMSTSGPGATRKENHFRAARRGRPGHGRMRHPRPGPRTRRG